MSITQDPPQLKTTRLESNSLACRRSSKKRIHQPDTPFHGVRRRSWGRYVSEIRLPGQKARVWLGSFGSPEMAARAYDSAAFFLKGHAASLNFPDLVQSLPRPESSSRRDIQLAAAKAAIGFESEKSNRVGFEESGMGGESESSFWLGLDDLETVSFEEVKKAPSLSPWGFGSFDSVGGDEESYFRNDEEFLLASCF